MILESEEVFGLPNIKSAKKRVLVSKSKAMQNKAAQSALKTDLKKFEAATVGRGGGWQPQRGRCRVQDGCQGGGQGCFQGAAAPEQCRQ